MTDLSSSACSPWSGVGARCGRAGGSTCRDVELAPSHSAALWQVRVKTQDKELPSAGISLSLIAPGAHLLHISAVAPFPRRGCVLAFTARF